ncbi:MAG: DMT family transporter [Coriobacteriales bacterium]|jgi:drug/metabolite transporter (DMT)-like permease
MDKSKLYMILPILAGIMWGITGVFVRYLSAGGLDNPTIVFTRLLVSAIILAVFILIKNRQEFKVPKKAIILLIAGSVIGCSYMNVVYSIAILHLHLALSSVLMGLFALWAIFLGRIFFGEKITARKMICVVVALFGVVLVTGLLEHMDAQTLSFYGLFMGFMTGIMYSVNGAATRVMGDWGMSSTTINFWYFLIGAISLLPLCHWDQVFNLIAAGPAVGVSLLVGQAVVCAILPYACFAVAMRHMEIGLVGTLALGDPIAGMVAGLLLFGEVPSVLMVVGVFVVIGAIAVAMRSPGERKAPPEQPALPEPLSS